MCASFGRPSQGVIGHGWAAASSREGVTFDALRDAGRRRCRSSEARGTRAVYGPTEDRSNRALSLCPTTSGPDDNTRPSPTASGRLPQTQNRPPRHLHGRTVTGRASTARELRRRALRARNLCGQPLARVGRTALRFGAATASGRSARKSPKANPDVTTRRAGHSERPAGGWDRRRTRPDRGQTGATTRGQCGQNVVATKRTVVPRYSPRTPLLR
jgi:hypothetical protein